MAPALLYGLIAAGAAIIGGGIALVAKRRPAKVFGMKNMVELANGEKLPAGDYKLVLLPQTEESRDFLKKYCDDGSLQLTDSRLDECRIFAIKDAQGNVIRVRLVCAKQFEPEIAAILGEGKSVAINYIAG